jgi:hypothetical protein
VILFNFSLYIDLSSSSRDCGYVDCSLRRTSSQLSLVVRLLENPTVGFARGMLPVEAPVYNSHLGLRGRVGWRVSILEG